MRIEDFRDLPLEELPGNVDVCLVGSGPAAWALSSELRGSGLRVVVLEAGGAEFDRAADAPILTEDVGATLFNGRRRTLGGTPEIGYWGNRCIAFDDMDYEARPWVPFSGWPFGREEISPYLDRASRYLGAGPYLPNGPVPPPSIRLPAVDPRRLRHVTWSFGRGESGGTIRFSKLFRQIRDPDLRIIINATVTHLNLNASGKRIESVEISDPEGRRGTISARTVVLCAGGIENARILLYSNRAVASGVGNEHGLVGRFLMDHPRDMNMTVTISPHDEGAFRRLFGPYRYNAGHGARVFVGGLALSPERQRRDNLLNCAAWPMEEWAADDPVESIKRVMKARISADWKDVLRDVGHAVFQPQYILRAVHSRVVLNQQARRKVKKVGFYISSEQRPDPDSRVTLSRHLDRHGLPIAKTDWRISDHERASQAALAHIIENEFQRLGLPKADLSGWARDGLYEEATLSDGCHPTGATRMANNPREGVVDADCQVHGVAGLYVAGSSVFSTSGHANPTLMIVSMAVRLALHLKAGLAKNEILARAPRR